MSFCHTNGVKIYPVYRLKTNTWHVEVNNNGKITTYEKQIKEGKILNGVECQDYIEKTYRYWYELINDKINGTD